LQKKRRAEEEKVKGNEALRSQDYKEAIQYYSKAIEYDPTLAASYTNRAFVFLKLKEYQKCIGDCNVALQLNDKYAKAYHRRAKASLALKNFTGAYQDFKAVMRLEPENEQVNAELKDCVGLMNKEAISIPEEGRAEQFKRVAIIEEDESEEEQSLPSKGVTGEQ